MTKNYLTIDEACTELGISRKTMYDYTHRRVIPYFKPTKKRIYFKREDIVSFMTRNRVATSEELKEQAAQ